MEKVLDSRGKEITVGCNVRVRDMDRRRDEGYTSHVVTVEDIDSRQDKPGDPVIVTFKLPARDTEDQYGNPTPHRDKWEYADMVQVVDADLFPAWNQDRS